MEISQPPPSAKPFTAAITGIGNVSSLAEYIVALLTECFALCLGQSAHLSDISTCYERFLSCAGQNQTSYLIQINTVQSLIQFIKNLQNSGRSVLFHD